MNREKYLSKVSLEIHSGPNRRGTWGRKQEEYIADFLKVTQRSLNEEEYKVFKYRFLLGADWKLCCRKLKIDRGPFHHMVYKIQTVLGEAFSELEPYALYPLDEYFGSPHRMEPVKALPGRSQKVIPIRPPVKMVAEARVEDEQKAA